MTQEDFYKLFIQLKKSIKFEDVSKTVTACLSEFEDHEKSTWEAALAA